MTAGDMKYHEGDVIGDEVEKIVESAYEVSGVWKSAISPLTVDQISCILMFMKL